MTYEDYSRTADNYDRTRRPVGLPIILGCFAMNDRPLSALHVLDAGCGTGSFAVQVSPRVGRISGVDASQAMVSQAIAKAAAAQIPSDRFSATTGQLEDLPFADAEFDGAMVNQVLHHLSDPDGSFARLRRPSRSCGESCGREAIW